MHLHSQNATAAVWDPCHRIAISELDNVPAWPTSPGGDATSVDRVTGISRRARAAGIADAILMVPEVTSATRGRANATARSGLEVSTATSVRRDSLASARRVVSGAQPAGRRVRCVTRTMDAAFAPSSPVAWDVDSVCRAPGDGRLDWVAGNANAITLAPLVSSAAPAMDNASAVRDIRAESATLAPSGISAIRSADDAAAMRRVPSPRRMAQ